MYYKQDMQYIFRAQKILAQQEQAYLRPSNIPVMLHLHRSSFYLIGTRVGRVVYNSGRSAVTKNLHRTVSSPEM